MNVSEVHYECVVCPPSPETIKPLALKVHVQGPGLFVRMTHVKGEMTMMSKDELRQFIEVLLEAQRAVDGLNKA